MVFGLWTWDFGLGIILRPKTKDRKPAFLDAIIDKKEFI
jgi:hypothetical protein